MTSHTAHTFLNSCFKVPIDPCNSCPAPRYNRKNLCLGHQTLKGEITTMTSTTTKNSDLDLNSIWNSNVISSLAEFYDSIPEYCDINHLPEEEFYTTLKSLKVICQDFKSKSMHSYVMHESSSNSSSTVSTQHCATILKVKEKSKDKRNKTKSGSKKSTKYAQKFRNNVLLPHGSTEPSSSSCAIIKASSKNNIIERLRIESYKKDFKDDTKSFQNALNYSEMELKNPPPSDIQKTNPELSETEKKDQKEAVIKIETQETPNSEIPIRHTNLRKSYSLNHINNIKDNIKKKDGKGADIEKPPKNPLIYDIKAKILARKDRDKLSNYFMGKINPEEYKMRCNTASWDTRTIQQNIPVESLCSDDFDFKYCIRRSNGGHKKRKKQKKSSNKLSFPFNLFNLSDSTKKGINNEKSRNPSPVHPVARPNLAATLRIEVSRRKVHELQNNCTVRDDATTPQNDWEVRNTPAWKSLTLNESHKQIIALRLATRKAEQALQHRVHEQNMELMRQRVKAAPLLLEGPTYWGNSVGKLTHCCKQCIKHPCLQRNPRKQHRKTTSDCATAKREHSCVTRSNSAASSRGKGDTTRTFCANKVPSHNNHIPKHSVPQLVQQAQQSGSSDNLSSADRSYL